MKTIDVRKILVPLDFSRNSVKALRFACVIAVENNASIYLLHVTDNDYDLYSKEDNLESLHFAETTKRLGVFAKSVIDQYNIKCFYTSEYGSVTHCILKSAINIHADLIILGKNGSNGRAPVYAGTHCCQVVEKSRIPVIIVPENIAKFNIEKILFPVRPLLSATGKYDAIRNLLIAKPAVTVLNLRNPQHNDELHIIHKLGQLLKARLEQDRVPYTMDYYFNDNKFAEKLLHEIDRRAYDLVIISSEADESKQDFNIGQYVQKIIHGASIPVLILHATHRQMDANEILDTLEMENNSIKK